MRGIGERAGCQRTGSEAQAPTRAAGSSQLNRRLSSGALTGSTKMTIIRGSGKAGWVRCTGKIKVKLFRIVSVESPSGIGEPKNRKCFKPEIQRLQGSGIGYPTPESRYPIPDSYLHILRDGCRVDLDRSLAPLPLPQPDGGSGRGRGTGRAGLGLAQVLLLDAARLEFNTDIFVDFGWPTDYQNNNPPLVNGDSRC
jgi:hypothetical protein